MTAKPTISKESVCNMCGLPERICEMCLAAAKYEVSRYEPYTTSETLAKADKLAEEYRDVINDIREGLGDG